jgi:hypothetical protein
MDSYSRSIGGVKVGGLFGYDSRVYIGVCDLAYTSKLTVNLNASRWRRMLF